jgi:hypothetical protein
MSYTDHAGFGEQDAAAPHRAPPKHQLPTVAIMLMLGLAVALSAAALAVTLLHAGPRGAAGTSRSERAERTPAQLHMSAAIPEERPERNRDNHVLAVHRQPGRVNAAYLTGRTGNLVRPFGI